MKKAVEKVAGGKIESSLEKGCQHHDLVGMSSRDFFILGRPPLDHGAVRKKMLSYELEELFPIDEGGLELLRV
jgi:hypothetical protein